MIKLNIALDLDNVVKDLIGQVINQADKEFGVELSIEDDFDKWDKPIGYKMGFKSQEEYLTWAWKNETIHWEAKPLPHATEIIPQLFEQHHITILTATEFPAMVAPWLQKWNIPYHQIICTQDKGQEDFDILIDDSPSNLEKLSYAGRDVIRFRYPYNDHLWQLPTMFYWSQGTLEFFQDVGYLFKDVR